MTALPQISEAEYEVMKVVWAHAPVSTNEITEYLAGTTDWSPKTIHTMLKRLADKGALTYEKQGRLFVYSPLVDQKEYVNQKSRSFLKRYYQGDFTALVSAYLEEERLSEEDIRALRELLSSRSR